MRRRTARAIEWVADLYQQDPSLTKPTDMSLIIHDIAHLITHSGTDWRSEVKLTLPFMAALDVAAGKSPAAKEKAFVIAYAKKSNGCFFRPDGSLCVHTDDDYNRVDYLPCRKNKPFQEQSARAYYHQSVRDFIPMAQHLVDIHDGKIPEYRDLLNLRLSFDDAGQLTAVRRPTAQECAHDALTPLRDVLSGIMVDETGAALPVSHKRTTIAPRAPEPLPEYRLAAWYAQTFPDIAPLIVASIPSESDGASGFCSVAAWRQRQLPPAHKTIQKNQSGSR